MDWKRRLRDILETAPVQGDDHYAWPREAVAGVIEEAAAAGVAVIGIEVWAISGREILAGVPLAGGGSDCFAWSAEDPPASGFWVGFVDRCRADAAGWLDTTRPEAEASSEYRKGLFYQISFMDPPQETPAEAPEDTVHALLARMFENAPIRNSLGMDIAFDAEDRAVFTLPPDPAFFHGMGDVHGGLITTVLDNAGWFAAAARVKRLVLTADLSIRLLAPARRQTVTATGRVIRAGRNMVVCEMTATAGGRTIAMGTGAFAVTGKKIGNKG